ncbi:MAG: malate dehydrogenase [bacterium]
MKYITQDKLVLLGAAGAIGSNMAQTALTLRLTPNVCLYDPFEKGLKGAAEEIYHCAFSGARVTWTTNISEALAGAKYLVSSGGAPRKEGMTREDLLKGNAEIAAQLGKDIKACCPDLTFAVIIFNPADITGLTTLVYSGLDPKRVATLAALDSTRLQSALARYFNVPQDRVSGCRTYGGHGEQMAVFASTTRVVRRYLTNVIGRKALPAEKWEQIKQDVRQGGKKIIELRGRSSFQSPSHQSLLMVKAVMDGKGYEWPVGCYINAPQHGFHNIMMAMETKLAADGVSWTMPTGTEQELNDLSASYGHLVKLRDEVITMGILPPLDQWSTLNPHLA